jgi:protein-tyrosine phosphatase
LERGINNVGPISALAIKAIVAMRLSDADAISRFPIQVTAEEMDQAAFIVALKQAEHLPLLQERFPAWVEKVEFWHVDDAPEVLGLIEREVMGLTARLIGGGKPIPFAWSSGGFLSRPARSPNRELPRSPGEHP